MLSENLDVILDIVSDLSEVQLKECQRDKDECVFILPSFERIEKVLYTEPINSNDSILQFISDKSATEMMVLNTSEVISALKMVEQVSAHNYFGYSFEYEGFVYIDQSKDEDILDIVSFAGVDSEHKQKSHDEVPISEFFGMTDTIEHQDLHMILESRTKLLYVYDSTAIYFHKFIKDNHYCFHFPSWDILLNHIDTTHEIQFTEIVFSSDKARNYLTANTI